jgi:hypothetical protein
MGKVAFNSAERQAAADIWKQVSFGLPFGASFLPFHAAQPPSELGYS